MLYAPALFAQPAPSLAPAAIVSGAPTMTGAPVRTALKLDSAQLNVLAGHRVNYTGDLLEAARPGSRGRIVALQALGRRGWHTLARTRTRAKGRFRISFVPEGIGSAQLRLRFPGAAGERPAHRRLGQLNVYRVALASWYGGGGTMACGGTLTSSTLGVANKTLPCGTLVTLRYGGHSVRVPVVDRGPYVAGREFDLTEATKQALGFAGVGEVWSTS